MINTDLVKNAKVENRYMLPPGATVIIDARM